MKKIIVLTILAVMFATVISESRVERDTLTPICQERTLNAFTMYIVGGSTTATGTYHFSGTSITCITTAGFYPGTTTFVLTDSDKDTVEELITYLNGVPITTKGAEGGIVAAKVQGGYLTNVSTLPFTPTATNCLASANKVTIALAYTTGITYTLPANLLKPEQQYCITGLSINVTFASGTTYLTVYNSTAAVSILHKEEIDTTATETRISLPMGHFAGSDNTAMRIDVVGDVAITAGRINIIGYKK